MRIHQAALGIVAALFIVSASAGAAGMPEEPAQRGQMMGYANHPEDMQALHYLFEHRAKITRTVTQLPDGIDTTTRSADPDVAARLKAHVAAMAKRMEERRPIHARDPFFAELFRHAADVSIRIQPLADGVRVIETSADPYVVKLLQEHARIVDLFLANGMGEMRRDHALPPR